MQADQAESNQIVRWHTFPFLEDVNTIPTDGIHP